MCECGHSLWDHDYFNGEKCCECQCNGYRDSYEKNSEERMVTVNPEKGGV